ncbi:hypothetical protein [Paraburkholderia caballeronis]|uniref:hypothetical protein n=1 Tax=Paraburkholderia caballeronis TaxID=416943 RepID=UPI00115FDDF6|nr:hypothetical protein [Paraburkholderia caballeronis]
MTAEAVRALPVRVPHEAAALPDQLLRMGEIGCGMGRLSGSGSHSGDQHEAGDRQTAGNTDHSFLSLIDRHTTAITPARTIAASMERTSGSFRPDKSREIRLNSAECRNNRECKTD